MQFRSSAASCDVVSLNPWWFVLVRVSARVAAVATRAEIQTQCGHRAAACASRLRSSRPARTSAPARSLAAILQARGTSADAKFGKFCGLGESVPNHLHGWDRGNERVRDCRPRGRPRREGGSSASCESSEMLGGDGQRDPFAGLAAQGVEHLRVNWSEDLYGEGGVERLVVGLSGAFTDDREMLLDRGGVGVDL